MSFNVGTDGGKALLAALIAARATGEQLWFGGSETLASVETTT
jgi:hypothetical protein